MRPIKFRARTTKNGWIDNNPRIEFREKETRVFIKGVVYDEDTRPYFIVEKGEVELFQFTGLLDKNGKEIYEGDIMAIKFSPHYVERISWKGEPDAIAEVFWDYNGFRLKANGKEDARYADFWDDNSYNFLDMSRKHSEVIGNIYENSDILN